MAIVVGTNSWVTLAEADTYFLTRIESDPWDALNDPDKEKYLVTAYNWIISDSAYSVLPDNDSQSVKNGQCEAALFLINSYDDWIARDGLIASGVKEFDYSKWSEVLGATKKPSFVSNWFDKEGLYSGDFYGIVLKDDSTNY